MNPRAKRKREKAAGWAMREAVDDTRRYADKLGVSQRTIQRYRNGHQSNRVAKFGREVLQHADDPWRIVAHLRAWAKWSVVREMTTRALVERWHELSDIEHDYEARQNRHHATGECPENEVRADESHAAVLEERAAVRLELDIRRVNPREFTTEADR